MAAVLRFKFISSHTARLISVDAEDPTADYESEERQNTDHPTHPACRISFVCMRDFGTAISRSKYESSGKDIPAWDHRLGQEASSNPELASNSLKVVEE